MKLYAFSGLGADKRVFQYLTLDCDLIPIEWIDPLESESIEAYSLRISECINTNEKFGLLGVSFGGLIAVEVSKLLNPEITILVSSVETNMELRFIYRIIGKTNILRIAPHSFFNPPRRLINWFFGTKQSTLLNQILDDTDLKFVKWALVALMGWKHGGKLENHVLKIGGSKDKLIPANKNDVLINGGEHFMIVDHANEISEVINEALS